MKAIIRIMMTMLLMTHAVAASSAENGAVLSSPGEYTLLTGYGVTHRGFGATRTQVQTYDLILRYGHFLSGEAGAGHWFQGRHEVLLELPFSLAVDHKDRTMVGGTLLGSWKFTGWEPVTPYLFVGGGLIYVDLGIPSMGTRWNGTYQAGGGIQHFIGKDLAVVGEYRYHHISNANTGSPNEPLNSSKFLLGLSWYR